MIKALASLLALALAAHSAPALAQVSYAGSSTIGEHIIPEAAKVFTAKTGIRFGTVEIQGSGKGLEMVLRGEAQLAGVARSLTLDEKSRRIHYQVIGYDAVSVFVHPTNPVATLTKQQLKGIYTGRITNWRDVGGPDAPIVCITQVWGAKRAQMVEFHESVMDGAPYRRDRKEVDLQSDQVAALLGVRVVTLQQGLAERVRALEDALARVKQLQGLLPICAWCKKVRNDRNYWQTVEGYVAEHSEARFSHGICPECKEKYVTPEIRRRREEAP